MTDIIENRVNLNQFDVMVAYGGSYGDVGAGGVGQNLFCLTIR